MSQTVDANGAIHDPRGRFDGHIQAEGDPAVLPAPALPTEFTEALQGAYESAATAIGFGYGANGWATLRPGIPEVFEQVDGDPTLLRVIPNPAIPESEIELAVFTVDDVNTYFGPDRDCSDGYDGPIVTAKLDAEDRTLVRLAVAHRYAQPLLDADQAKYLYDASGVFYLGPIEGDVNELADTLSGAVEIRCVWEYADYQGMNGEQTLIGRVPGGIWRPISTDLDNYLRRGEADSEVPTHLLADEPYEPEMPLDRALITNGANLTFEKRGGVGGYLW